MAIGTRLLSPWSAAEQAAGMAALSAAGWASTRKRQGRTHALKLKLSGTFHQSLKGPHNEAATTDARAYVTERRRTGFGCVLLYIYLYLYIYYILA